MNEYLPSTSLENLETLHRTATRLRSFGTENPANCISTMSYHDGTGKFQALDAVW